MRVLESPHARAEHRIAAALALSASNDPTARDRVRVVAASSADGRVRVALEQIGKGEIDDGDLTRVTEANVVGADRSG